MPINLRNKGAVCLLSMLVSGAGLKATNSGPLHRTENKPSSDKHSCFNRPQESSNFSMKVRKRHFDD